MPCRMPDAVQAKLLSRVGAARPTARIGRPKGWPNRSLGLPHSHASAAAGRGV